MLLSVAAPQDDAVPIVPGRACGSCTLCCKVLSIEELDKPTGAWCTYCKPGRGCGIHATRPPVCRQFHCAWLLREELGPEWWPATSKMVVVAEEGGRRILAHVDPQRPEIWRTPPYHARLRHWAAATLPTGGQVVVCIGRRTFVVLPDRDVDLGIVGPDDRIVLGEQPTPFGPRLDAFKLHKDDPRLTALALPA